jgi:hypothetical protein
VLKEVNGQQKVEISKLREELDRQTDRRQDKENNTHAKQFINDYRRIK